MSETARKGFYFDQNLCSGCRTCQVACKDVNDLDVGVLFRKVTSYETGAYPTARLYHLTIACNHCESPACAAGCPTGATFIDEADGTVLHDDSKCIGCQYCVKSCPYGAPQYLEALNLVHKCNGCKDLRDSGELPACVSSCPNRALEFGPIDELRAAHPEGVNAIVALPDPGETNPSLVIDAREAAFDESPREVFF